MEPNSEYMCVCVLILSGKTKTFVSMAYSSTNAFNVKFNKGGGNQKGKEMKKCRSLPYFSLQNIFESGKLTEVVLLIFYRSRND